MKKYAILVFTFLLFICGCESMMNTPTKRVEEFLSKYQRQDEEVLTQLDDVVLQGNYNFNEDQTLTYKEVMKRQYQDLTYTIKEEMIDGDNATVTVEIEVYDYNSVLDSAEEYYTKNPQEFKTDTGELDESKYTDYKIKQMKETKDKIKYTLNLTLTRSDKKWILNDITEADRQKIHGIYNS